MPVHEPYTFEEHITTNYLLARWGWFECAPSVGGWFIRLSNEQIFFGLDRHDAMLSAACLGD